jgi:hypothetical protein
MNTNDHLAADGGSAVQSLDAAGVAATGDCGEAGHMEGRCGNARCLSGNAGAAQPRIVGPTLMVPTGGSAVMTVSLPGADPHLEWSLRYGSPEAVRFLAASVVESFDYLLSDHINMTEATRRLRILRAAIAKSGAAA